MRIVETGISGCFMVEADTRQDARGWFRESWRWSALSERLGYEPRLRQNNHSRSNPRVLRGFHAEPWSKLIYVARGTALLVVADIRTDSPTFGRSFSTLAGDAPGTFHRLYVERGLANAFYCFSEVDYLNDVSEEFSPEGRRGVVWNDPMLAVAWPDPNPIVSDVDRDLPTVAALTGRTRVNEAE